MLLNIQYLFSQVIPLPSGYEEIEFPGSEYIHVVKNGKMGLMQLDSVSSKWIEIIPPKYDLIVDFPENYYNLAVVVENGVMYPYNLSLQLELTNKTDKSIELFDDPEMFSYGINLNDTLPLFLRGSDTISFKPGTDNENYNFYQNDWMSKNLRIEFHNQHLVIINVSYSSKNTFAGIFDLSTHDWRIKPVYFRLKKTPMGVLTALVAEDSLDETDDYYNEWGFTMPDEYKIGLINNQLQTVLEPKTLNEFDKKDTLAFLPNGAKIFKSDDLGNVFYYKNEKMGVYKMNLNNLSVKSIIPEKYEFIIYIPAIQRYVAYASNRFDEYIEDNGTFKISSQIKPTTSYEYKIGSIDYLEIDGKQHFLEVSNKENGVSTWKKSDKSIDIRTESIYGINKINEDVLLVNNGPNYAPFVPMMSHIYPDEDSIDDDGMVVYYPRDRKVSKLYSLKDQKWIATDYISMFKSSGGFISTKVKGSEDPVFGVISDDFKVVVPFKYRHISEHYGMYITRDKFKNLSAYNSKGELVVKSNGCHELYFKDGFFHRPQQRIHESDGYNYARDENGRYIYLPEMIMDKNGKEIKVPYQVAALLDHGIALVYQNKSPAAGRNKTYGFYDLNTKRIIVEPKYKILFDNTPEFVGNYWMKEKDKGWNYYSVSNEVKTILNHNYDNLFQEETIYMTSLNNKYGFVGKDGEVLLNCEYNIAKRFSVAGNYLDGIVIEKNDHYGIFFNPARGANGIPEISLAVEYDTVVLHPEEKTIELVKNGKHGLIDMLSLSANLDWVLPCKYDGNLKYLNGVYLLEKKGKYGMVNQAGDIVLPIKYEKIEARDSHFSDATKRLIKSFKVSKKNENGELVSALYTDNGWFTKFIYSEIEQTSNSRYLIAEQKADHKKFLYDILENKMIFEVEGIIKEKKETMPITWIKGDGKTHYFGTNELMSIDQAFDEVVKPTDYTKKFWLVANKGKYGVYDLVNNAYIFKPIYDTLYRYNYSSDQMVGLKEGKFGIIDLNRHKVLVEFMYDSLAQFCYQTANLYSNGGITSYTKDNFEIVYENIKIISSKNNLYLIEKDGKKYLYNCSSNKLSEQFVYDDFEVLDFPFIKIKKNDKYGIIDLDSMEVLVPPAYDQIKPVYVDKYYFIAGNKNPWAFMDTKPILGLVNKKGVVLVPLEYEAYTYSDYSGLKFQKDNLSFVFEDGKLRLDQ